MRRVVIAVLLLGCGDFPAWGDRPDPYDVDPAFGEPVIGLPPVVRGTLDGVWKADRVVLGMWLVSGADAEHRPVEPGFQVWEIDPDTLEVFALPAPPLVSESYFLATAFDDARALLVQTAGTPVLEVFDGSWHAVEAPPGIDVAQTGAFALAPDRIWAADGATMQLWTGAAWNAVPIAGERLGPIARDRFRTVSAGPCTRLWDVATLTAGDAVCGAGCGAVSSNAVNGTPEGFSVSCTDGLWTFADDAWTGPVDGGSVHAVYATVGGPFAWSPAPEAGERFPRVMLLDAGGPVVGVDAFSPILDCACDRDTDPTCGCVQPTVEYAEHLVSGDGAATMLLTTVVANGERAVYFRRFDLPSDEAPFPGWDAADTGF